MKRFRPRRAPCRACGRPSNSRAHLSRLVLLLALLCPLFVGCKRSPEVVTTPPVSLPTSEHAYGLPVTLLLMVPPDLDRRRRAEMEELCLKQRLPELEEPEDEAEVAAEDLAPNDPPDPRRFTELLGSPALENALETRRQNRDPTPRLPHPMGLPEVGLSPAVLTVTLEEITWMGKTVETLVGGRVVGGSDGNLLMEPLTRAAAATIAATKEAVYRCGLPMTGSTALVVMDTRVPVDTFNRAVYSLGYGGFTSYALAVSDPTPELRRLDNPVGGRSGAGDVQVTSASYRWKKRLEAGDDDEPWQKVTSEWTSWPRSAPLPPHLGETSAPSVTLRIDPERPYGDLVEIYDRLSETKVFCVTLALGSRGAPAASGKASPGTAVRLDPRGSIPVHVVEPPSRVGGMVHSRLDGTRCLMEPRLLQIRGTRIDEDPNRGTRLKGTE